MEAAPWLPGLILAVVSSLILLLFLATLLLARLPRLQKWLSPVLSKIAPAPSSTSGGGSSAAHHPSSSNEDQQDVIFDGGSRLVYQHHSSGQYQRYKEDPHSSWLLIAGRFLTSLIEREMKKFGPHRQKGKSVRPF